MRREMGIFEGFFTRKFKTTDVCNNKNSLPVQYLHYLVKAENSVSIWDDTCF